MLAASNRQGVITVPTLQTGRHVARCSTVPRATGPCKFFARKLIDLHDLCYGLRVGGSLKVENGHVSEIEVREVGADAKRFELRPVSLEETQNGVQAPPTARVSAIIAAYNEQDTIVDVIRCAEGHPLVDEIIVVDDGSSDATAERARTTSAKVISLEHNSGKAAAMHRGVQTARNHTILFLDADILGLTHEMITLVVMPVLTRQCGMFVAIRDRRAYWMNRLLYFVPVLGGERALTKDIWRLVPRIYRQGFQIEIALNFYTKKSGSKMGFGVMPGLTQVIKEKKRGFWLGLAQRVKMSAEVFWISFRLYVIRNAIIAFRGLGRHGFRPRGAQTVVPP